MSKAVSMEEKVDFIFDAIKDILPKFENLEKTLNDKFDQLQKHVNSNLFEIQHQLDNKAASKDCAALQERISTLEKQVRVMKLNSNNEMLMKESYSKRNNILIHGLPETEAWESREKSLIIFQEFIREGLKIADPSFISVVDVHRLPQRPISKEGRLICRPIIVKLASILDKERLFKNAKNLKSYNEKRDPNPNSSDKSNRLKSNRSQVYMTDHLPKEFVAQKKILYPKFIEAKRNKSKTFWRIENGCYNLYVDDVKAELEQKGNCDPVDHS